MFVKLETRPFGVYLVYSLSLVVCELEIDRLGPLTQTNASLRKRE